MPGRKRSQQDAPEPKWRAEDDQEAEERALQSDDLPEGAADAVLDMEAHEQRRDQTHRTGGDDYSPGVDTDMDTNAPKQQELPSKKRGGSRGKSD